MKEKMLYWAIWASFFFLLPYYITYAVNGAETAFLNKSFDMEKCIPLLLALEISDEFEEDAIKAQAVIARSNFYFELQEKEFLEILQGVKKVIRGKISSNVDKFKYFYSYPQKIYRNSVLSTKNLILTYESQKKMVPYHLCSGGKTRNGEDAFRSSEYSYLQSVDSGFDKEYDQYISITYSSEERLSGDMSIKECDEAGYVVSLEMNGKILEGESFRKSMNLPSSNFELQKVENEYRIICRGVGHGIGFSQYGGNELAKKGKTWEEILEIYFPLMEIETVKENER